MVSYCSCVGTEKQTWKNTYHMHIVNSSAWHNFTNIQKYPVFIISYYICIWATKHTYSL